MSLDMMGSFHRLQLEGCDKCGHRASYEVMFGGGRTLRFCGHHFSSPEVCALGFNHVRDL